ncbi:MAG: c-type cytochrome biogenesis protein CcmI [Pseudomarimonas sp.]
MTALFWILCTGMAVFALAFVLPPLLRDASADSTGESPQSAPGKTAAGKPGATRVDPRKRRALEKARDAGVLDQAEYQRKLAALAGPDAAADSPSKRDPTLPIVLTVLLPFAAFALYHHLGEPQALDPEKRASTASAQSRLVAPGTPAPPPSTSSSTDATGAPNMDQAVAGLAERMRESPDDLDGWMLLGRAYKTMERFEPAREALANAIRLAPDNPDVMVEYAEASALASESRRLGGESLLLIQRALGIEPEHQRGLWLLGISSMQAGVPSKAVEVWERLLPLVDESARESLLTQIDSARESAGLPPREKSATPATAADPRAATAPVTAQTTPAPVSNPAQTSADEDAAGTARLVVNVDIDPALKSKIGASDVLFVYARAANGPRMPLAIQRLSAADLPARVVLDDSTSMMPTMKLSLMPQVVVGARISKSGQATPQSGDFETVSAPVSNRSSAPLSLLIDKVVP